MDSGLSKRDTLLMLQKKHPDHAITFVKDRLQTLLDILDNHPLQAIELLLLSWEFNTPEEQLIAPQNGIEIIDHL